MTWTPLHRALGDTSNSLTYFHVTQAVMQQIEETAALDWKRSLPITQGKEVSAERKEKERYELAKDIAAMANSGGGIIVYGVAETTVDGRTAAGSIIQGLEITTDCQKTIRQAAFSTVHPPVAGVELTVLTDEENSENSVLVMSVPESSDAPHLVVQKGDGGFFQAPWRNGPETFFMTERDLATAYREREQHRREQFLELDNLHRRFRTVIGAEEQSVPWTIAVARPVKTLTRLRGIIPKTAEQIFVQATNAPWTTSGLTALSEAKHGTTTRRGLRHHYWTSARHMRGRSIQTRVEVHDDGSLAVALTRDGMLHPEVIEPEHTAIEDIERVGLDLLALILTQQAACGPIGDYDIVIDVAPNAKVFRRPDPFFPNHVAAYSDSDLFPVFQPVKGTLVTTLGRTELLDSALGIIRDAMNQVNSGTQWTLGLLEDQISAHSSELFCVE